MRFIFSVFLFFAAIKIGFTHGSFGAFLAAFVGLTFGLGLIWGTVKKSATEALNDDSRTGPAYTMDQGVDILQKANYLMLHGAMQATVVDRIQNDLNQAKIKNLRPLRDNELMPIYQKLDVYYADDALRTVLASGFLYEGEGEEIEARMEAKLDSLEDGSLDQSQTAKQDTEKGIKDIYEALQ